MVTSPGMQPLEDSDCQGEWGKSQEYGMRLEIGVGLVCPHETEEAEEREGQRFPVPKEKKIEPGHVFFPRELFWK